VLDLKLPRRDGCEVLQRMRSSAQCGHVPVVILTSSNLREDRQRATTLGVTQFLRKPDLLDDFMDLGGVFKGIIERFRSQ
jgi:CheY-like chemotaxis protein